jgi:hypothetical protein
MNMINSLTSKEIVSQISNALIYIHYFSLKLMIPNNFDVWIKRLKLINNSNKKTWRAQKDNTSMKRKYVVTYLTRIDWRS